MQRSFNCALEHLSNVFHCPQELRNKLIECAHLYSTPLQQFLSHHDLGVFGWESVDSRRTITDQTKEDVLIKLHEAGRNEITYGFGLQVARRGGNIPSGTIALPGLPPITSGAPNFTAEEKKIGRASCRERV